MAGAYIASLFVVDAGWDPLLALPFAMTAVAVIAYPLQRLLLTPLLRGSATAPLVGTFGVSLVGQAIFQAVFGSHPRTFRRATRPRASASVACGSRRCT